MLGEFLSANVSAPFLLFMVESFDQFSDEAEVGKWTILFVRLNKCAIYGFEGARGLKSAREHDNGLQVMGGTRWRLVLGQEPFERGGGHRPTVEEVFIGSLSFRRRRRRLRGSR